MRRKAAGVIALVLVAVGVLALPGVAAAAGPVTLFPDTAVPATPVATDPAPGIQVGLRFSSSLSGSVTGLRFYKGAGNDGVHVGRLWSSAGTMLAAVTFANETPSGWQSQVLSAAVPLSPGAQYIVTYWDAEAKFALDPAGLTAGYGVPPLQIPSTGGVYGYGDGSAFPPNSTTSNYWADVVFQSDSVAAAPCPSGVDTPYPCVYAVNVASGASTDVGPVVTAVDGLRATLVVGIALLLFLAMVALVIRFGRSS